MRVGGWSTHKAFYRYVNVDDRQMEEVFGIDDIWDDSWKGNLAPKAF